MPRAPTTFRVTWLGKGGTVLLVTQVRNLATTLSSSLHSTQSSPRSFTSAFSASHTLSPSLSPSTCFIFIEQFQVHSKTEQKVLRFPRAALPPPVHSVCLTISAPPRWLQLMNLRWLACPAPPELIVYVRAHSWCCVFCGFGQMYDGMALPLWYHTK